MSTNFQKFVDNAQQCFAFTPQANFPTHRLFTEGEGDGIESRLHLKTFSTLCKMLYFDTRGQLIHAYFPKQAKQESRKKPMFYILED